MEGEGVTGHSQACVVLGVSPFESYRRNCLTWWKFNPAVEPEKKCFDVIVFTLN